MENSKKLSMIIVLGDRSTGKTVLTKFMEVLMGLSGFEIGNGCDVEDLIESSRGDHWNKVSLLKYYAVFDSVRRQWPAGLYEQKMFFKTLTALIKFVNNGITYENGPKMVPIKIPATLVLELYIPILKTFKKPTYKQPRECITLCLPYKKHCDINSTLFVVEKCMTEFNAILDFIKMKSIWITFNFLFKNMAYELHDLQVHMFHLLTNFVDPILDFETKKVLCEARF